MAKLAELEHALQQLLAGGVAEVHEDGRFLAELSDLHYELRGEGKHPLLHLWSADRSLARRILRVAELGPGHVVIEVQRFGAKKPGKLEILRPDRARPPVRLDRERFRTRLERLLAEQFPDERVESLSTAPDLEHSFSGCYTRGVLSRGQRAWAVLGVSLAEDLATIDEALGFGLLWLDWVREHSERRAVEGLRLFLPADSGRLTAHRLQGLGAVARVELYEWREGDARARGIDSADLGNLMTWLTPRRDVEQTLAAVRELGEKICALAPQEIETIVPPGTREAAWRFRGLEFARWASGRVWFGVGDDRRELHERTWSELEALVRQLSLHRSPLAEDRNHALYRAAAERWLESLVLADSARLDARLDPGRIYSQVPAFSAGDRGVIDVLGVTRDGRLAVLELKASEDIQLPLQALDYWLRVRWHHREGDFPRYGYFAGSELRPDPPLLFLVAPGFRFHPAIDVLLRYLSSEVPVVRIGLNENWRRGLQVVFRQ